MKGKKNNGTIGYTYSRRSCHVNLNPVNLQITNKVSKLVVYNIEGSGDLTVALNWMRSTLYPR